MPQFDFFSFFVQLVYLTISACGFYLIYLKYFLKNTCEAIKIREKIITLLEKKHLSNKSLWNKTIKCLSNYKL